MNAAITAGALMNRRNWSIESIVVSPKDNAPRSCALLHPLRDGLIGCEQPIGNGGPTHREERQNRNHG